MVISTEPGAQPINGQGDASVKDQASEEEKRKKEITDSNNHSKLKIDGADPAGRQITDIYFKRNTYVIYCTGEGLEKQVLVYYSDDDETADKQIAGVSELIPLRNQLQCLLREMLQALKESKTMQVDARIDNRYHAQIAEAFRLGLERNIDMAKATLEGAIQEVRNINASLARDFYIRGAIPWALAGAVGALIAAAFFLSTGNANFLKPSLPLAHLLIASSAGAVGALLSIAISVRARVPIDGNKNSIRNDAMIRIMMGVISAGVIYLIAGSGLLAQIQIGDFTFQSGSIPWQATILLGFAAGFLERLVPDLLEKKAA